MRPVRVVWGWLVLVLSACQSAAPIAQEPAVRTPPAVDAPSSSTGTPALGIDLRLPPTRVPRPSPSAAPAIRSSPSAVVSASPNASVSVTLADDGRTITLQSGQRALVTLGDDVDWTVQIDDESIVSRVPGVTVIRGAQGIYQAQRVGQTALTATGDPACRTAQPACGQPSRTFKVTIAVQ